MRAIWFHESGDADKVMQLGEKTPPAPGPGEVLVRLHASGVNPSDVKKRAGAQPAGFVDGFVIPHSDGAGIVSEVGMGVSGLKVGDRVWVYQAQYQRHWGTAAELVVLPEARVIPLPEQASYAIGACAGIPMMTAHRCVFADGDVAGKTVLVTGASGRVGYYAAQWAKQAGANVIATAGSESRCDQATQTGADHVLNYRETDLVSAIKDITNGIGVDRIVDVEFGRNIETSSQILKTSGVIASYSSSKEMQPTIPFYPLMFNNITMQLVLVYNMPEAAKQAAAEGITQALATDALKHRIAESYALEETARAHQAIETGGLDGCVVVEF
ncbi:MAG: NADPH:quinone reductase [Acidiferrobacterales bacterium]|nr:NADPH:quinone reductase [Acidiferrobacterales bacterium]